MNHNLNLLITIYLLTSISLCHGMETSIQKITCIEDPYRSLYLTNDRVVISNNKQCSLVNSNTNTEIIKISDLIHPYVAMDSKRKKLLLYNSHNIEVYDTQTGTTQYCEKKRPFPLIQAATFGSANEQIITNSCDNTQIRFFNYITNENKIYTGNKNYKESFIACNPIKNELCIAKAKTSVCIYGENYSLMHEYKDKSFLSLALSFCEYSPDGSFIVIGGHGKIIIMDSQSYKTNTITRCLPCSDYFNKIAIHPNNQVIATLLNPNNTIIYYDAKTLELLHQEPALGHDSKYVTRYIQQSLSISPDGNNLLVALPDMCVILRVPFNALYQKNITTKFPSLLLLLKHLPLLTDTQLKDLIPQIALNLFKAFKR